MDNDFSLRVRSNMMLKGLTMSSWGKLYGFTPVQIGRVINKGWGRGNPESVSWKIVQQMKDDGLWPASEISNG